jgi:hypothetical protein
MTAAATRQQILVTSSSANFPYGTVLQEVVLYPAECSASYAICANTAIKLQRCSC